LGSKKIWQELKELFGVFARNFWFIIDLRMKKYRIKGEE